MDGEDGVRVVGEFDGRPCVVVFGGLAEVGPRPPFEMGRALEDVDATFVLLRDLDQCFYQGGIRGLGDTLAASVDALREMVLGHDPAGVLLIGQSSGGFAALWAASRFPEADVLAWSPQSRIDLGPQAWERQEKHQRRMEVAAARAEHPDDLDLTRCTWAPEQHLVGHYPLHNEADVAHADRLRHRVEMIGWPTDVHALARRFRNRGTLVAMVDEALARAVSRRR